MSINQTSGTRRRSSPLTGYRHDKLPFGLDADFLGTDFSREKPLSETLIPDATPFRLFAVRLCPRARQRIGRLLALPELHPEVRQIYCGLLAWASD